MSVLPPESGLWTTVAQCPLWPAGSSDRCNIGWGFEAQSLTRPFIELPSHAVELRLPVHRQVASLSASRSTSDGAQQHVRERDEKPPADKKHGGVQGSGGPVAALDGVDQIADRVRLAKRGHEVQQPDGDHDDQTGEKQIGSSLRLPARVLRRCRVIVDHTRVGVIAKESRQLVRDAVIPLDPFLHGFPLLLLACESPDALKLRCLLYL
jgi:hypothetical protein